MKKTLEASTEIDVEGTATTFGNSAEELSMFKKLAVLHQKNIPILRKELVHLQDHRRYLAAWRAWGIARCGASRAKLERLGPEPEAKNFISIEE